MEQHTENLDRLREEFERNPLDHNVGVGLAECYVDLGWFNEALEVYEKLFERERKEFSLLLSYGNLCYCCGKHDKARELFETLTQLKPNRLEGWNNLGIVLLMLEKNDEAKSAFRKVLELEPNNCGALMNMGNYFDRVGMLDSAVAYFQKACDARPDFSDAWYNLGNAYRRTDRYYEAAGAYERALRYQPEFPSALKNLGYVHELRREYDKAQECYHKALQYDKTDAGLYINIASVCSKQGNYEDAKDYYLRAVKLAPKDPSGWMGLRSLSLMKGDLGSYVRSTNAILHRLDGNTIAETLETLRRLRQYGLLKNVLSLSERLNRSEPGITAERMLAGLRDGENSKIAEELYHRLSGLSNSTEHVQRCLIEYELAKGNVEKAEKRLQVLPEDGMKTRRLRWNLLCAGGRWDEVQKSTESYLRGDPECFDAWYMLARAEIHLGEEKHAREHFINALDNGFAEFELLCEEPGLQQMCRDLTRRESPETTQIENV